MIYTDNYNNTQIEAIQVTQFTKNAIDSFLNKPSYDSSIHESEFYTPRGFMKMLVIIFTSHNQMWHATETDWIVKFNDYHYEVFHDKLFKQCFN